MTDPDLLSLGTAAVQALQPYQPGKPLDELEREYGIKHAVKLASNENPLGPGPAAQQTIRACLNDLARYPDGNGFALKLALSNRHGVAPEQVTLGNGSNDILELLARAFLTPDHEVIFSEHAFAVYPIVTQAVGARAIITPAKNWGYDLDAVLAAITANTRLIFIANPNNPTGTWLTKTELAGFLSNVPPQVLVVLDEAYFEYASALASDAEEYPNGMQWLNQYPNLVVTRTFSKAYGLAGLRIGYSVSHADVADLLNRVRQPFNVNSLALAAAEVALDNQEHIERSLVCNVQGMKLLTQAFTRLGLEYILSIANFVSVNVGDAAAVYNALLHEGVIVRPVANYAMPEYLRISIGTAEENDRCITALNKVLKK